MILTLYRTAFPIPIGKTLVIGSIEEDASATDIAFKQTPATKILIMIRPTKVIGLDWPKPFNIFDEIDR
ncbi:MAG: hypothetical protein ACI957_000938 [Verrucomicrobiales bacterium]|jgi:hypothetical protein